MKQNNEQNVANLFTRYYERYWDSEFGDTAPAEFSDKERQVFSRYLNSQTKVLDLGCADGEHYGRYICQLVKEYHGVDISPVAVAKARQNGIEAIVHDLGQSFPYPDEYFDLIICLEVLEHLFDPAFTVRECARVLKDKGIMIVSVPNTVYFPTRIKFLLGRFHPGGGAKDEPWLAPHIRHFIKRSIENLFQKNGFRILQFMGKDSWLLLDLPFFKNILWQGTARKLSKPFKFLEDAWPTLFASSFLIIVEKGHKALESRNSGSKGTL